MPAFNAKDNDDLFGGPRPRSAPYKAAPVRVDCSKWSRLDLVTELKRARETFEEEEQRFVARNDFAFASRLQLLGQHIAALLEIESRMRAAMKKEEGNKCQN